MSEGDGASASSSKKGPSRAITDIAAAVEEIQPKGNTLSTAIVKTTVPFLLKHPLREYQHIGLDWLVAMYEKKLNGILADEMGLGKTIQTIALLAHLACDKGIWGPHLIVVPTSVMLNWEMEFKKWCPAFKTMTYYGSQKERKIKRQVRFLCFPMFEQLNPRVVLESLCEPMNQWPYECFSLRRLTTEDTLRTPAYECFEFVRRHHSVSDNTPVT